MKYTLALVAALMVGFTGFAEARSDGLDGLRASNSSNYSAPRPMPRPPFTIQYYGGGKSYISYGSVRDDQERARQSFQNRIQSLIKNTKSRSKKSSSVRTFRPITPRYYYDTQPCRPTCSGSIDYD